MIIHLDDLYFLFQFDLTTSIWMAIFLRECLIREWDFIWVDRFFKINMDWLMNFFNDFYKILIYLNLVGFNEI